MRIQTCPSDCRWCCTCVVLAMLAGFIVTTLAHCVGCSVHISRDYYSALCRIIKNTVDYRKSKNVCFAPSSIVSTYVLQPWSSCINCKGRSAIGISRIITIIGTNSYVQCSSEFCIENCRVLYTAVKISISCRQGKWVLTSRCSITNSGRHRSFVVICISVSNGQSVIILRHSVTDRCIARKNWKCIHPDARSRKRFAGRIANIVFANFRSCEPI